MLYHHIIDEPHLSDPCGYAGDDKVAFGVIADRTEGFAIDDPDVFGPEARLAGKGLQRSFLQGGQWFAAGIFADHLQLAVDQPGA